MANYEILWLSLDKNIEDQFSIVHFCMHKHLALVVHNSIAPVSTTVTAFPQQH